MLCPTRSTGASGARWSSRALEIGEVVGKPVAVVGSLRASEAAHVHRDAGAVGGKLIDDELPGLAGIAPAVHEHERVADRRLASDTAGTADRAR